MTASVARASGPFWTPERVYAAYRISLAFSLLALFLVTFPAPVVGRLYPALFLIAAFVFLVLTIVSTLWTSAVARLLPRWSAMPAVVVDILLLTLLLHASGGMASNFGVLLVVTVAAAGILLPDRGGLFAAALAAVAIMFEQFWFSINVTEQNPFHLTESALLGVTFFATAIIIRMIVQRLARSEALARTQQRAIEQLEALNNKIVQRMRTGILVVDDQFRIILANPSAEQLFGMAAADGDTLTAPPDLRHLYDLWRSNPEQRLPPLQPSATGPSVRVRFAPLRGSREDLMLIFLEDERHLVQQAQQLKLSSLGRMSATIAHEIRNPLSAINHAAGLLGESSREQEDARLLEIIQAHVARVNRIVDDILSLSRRPESAAQRLSLNDFLLDFLQGLENHHLDPGRIEVEPAGEEIEVRFDPQQLEQVLINLVMNAFRHGGDPVKVVLSTGIDPRFGLPWLRVRDTGKGISPRDAQHLFEPFFTTSRQGTGLGLYICRELCEANQARLDHEEGGPGACFVITFAHPDRVFQ